MVMREVGHMPACIHLSFTSKFPDIPTLLDILINAKHMVTSCVHWTFLEITCIRPSSQEKDKKVESHCEPEAEVCNGKRKSAYDEMRS
jgi:hypothetical protein